MRRIDIGAEIAVMLARDDMGDRGRVADETVRQALLDQHPRPRQLPLELWPRVLVLGGAGKRAL